MGVMEDTLDSDLQTALTRTKASVTVNADGTFNVELVVGSVNHPTLYENIDATALNAAILEFTDWIAAKIA